MSELPSLTEQRIDPPADAGWWVQRVGHRTWLGHTASGATVLMADPEVGRPGAFTPGDLLKLALAGCAGMSSEGPASRRLGEDYPATLAVSGIEHPSEERYESLDVQILLNTAGLDDGQRKTLIDVISRSIAKECTIGLTVQNGAIVSVEIEDAPSSPVDS